MQYFQIKIWGKSDRNNVIMNTINPVMIILRAISFIVHLLWHAISTLLHLNCISHKIKKGKDFPKIRKLISGRDVILTSETMLTSVFKKTLKSELSPESKYVMCKIWQESP